MQCDDCVKKKVRVGEEWGTQAKIEELKTGD